MKISAKKKAAFAFSVIASAFLLTEGVARLCEFGPEAKAFRSRRGLEKDLVRYEPDAYCNYRIASGSPLVNSLGFQGPEPGPKTKLRVAWLGGSTSTGYPQMDEPGWPTLVFDQIGLARR